jgi:hypothetical protein
MKTKKTRRHPRIRIVQEDTWKDRTLRVVADEHVFGLAALTKEDIQRANEARAKLSTKEQHEQDDLYEAQLNAIKDRHPETVRLMLKAYQCTDATKKEETEKEALSTWRAEVKAEVFVRDGMLLGGIATPADKKRIAAALRRKPRRFDRVDYELALNWIQKGYCDMKRRDLAAAVNDTTGRQLSPDTIAKRAERLGLATTDKVKPGPLPRPAE